MMRQSRLTAGEEQHHILQLHRLRVVGLEKGECVLQSRHRHQVGLRVGGARPWNTTQRAR